MVVFARTARAWLVDDRHHRVEDRARLAPRQAVAAGRGAVAGDGLAHHPPPVLLLAGDRPHALVFVVVGPSDRFDLLHRQHPSLPPLAAHTVRVAGCRSGGLKFQRCSLADGLTSRPRLHSREAVLTALADPAFDPRAVALATTALPLPEAAPDAAVGDVALVGEDARYAVLRTASAAPGVLVYGGAMYPGWQATVDGVAAPVVEVDGELLGVAVPAGTHTVALVFRPASFRLGLALALSAALLLVGIGLADLRRGRERVVPHERGGETG